MPKDAIDPLLKAAGEAIRAARKAAGLTQKQLAKELDLENYQNVQHWEKGSNRPDFALMTPLGEALNINVKALYERTPRVASDEPPAPSFRPRPEVLENLKPPTLEWIDAPVYDARGSLGLGIQQPENDTIVNHLRLSATWVRQHLPTISSTHALSVITAYGNSMEPIFRDGDVLLLDTAVHNIKTDQVYALAFGQELYIKWLQRLPDGSLNMISNNPAFEPIKIRAEEAESLKVVGRVVYAWNGKNL